MANIAGKLKLSATQQSIKGVAILFAILVIVGVVGYSEVMFLQVISSAFPDGILKVVAMIGGVATGLSVLTLLLAKAYWFRPGHQLTWSWIFTGVEVVILTLNVLLSFGLSSGPLKPGDWLLTWYTLCPSSPLFALVGWTVLIMMDHSQRERHDYMEMEDEQRASMLDHERAVHGATMDLRGEMLKNEVHYFKEHMKSPEVQASMKTIAQDVVLRELSSFAGRYIAGMQQQQSLPAIGHRPAALPQPGEPVTGNLSDLFAQMDSQAPSDTSGASGQVPDGDIYNANGGKPKFTSFPPKGS